MKKVSMPVLILIRQIEIVLQKNTHLIRDIISMPSHHIEGREILFCSKELTAKLLHNGITRTRDMLKPGHWN